MIEAGAEEYYNLHPEDLWVYNKLQLSRMLGYTCGPVGVEVPKSDFYIVRPSVNFLGMGRNANIEWISGDTDHYDAGSFWCEVFNGPHFSVDYQHKKCKLVVEGIREHIQPLWRWDRWEKVDISIDFPPILEKLVGDYEWINCEFIGNHLIEVQIRQNPDFQWGNTIAIPVWRNESRYYGEYCGDYQFISYPDYNREGFYIDWR